MEGGDADASPPRRKTERAKIRQNQELGKPWNVPPIEEASMALRARWLGTFVCAATMCASAWTALWAEQSAPQQAPSQRDDPATSGAGPSSGAPGQLNYDPPKGGSVTTDSKGVTTTQPKSDAPKTNEAPADFGNDSAGTTPPK